MTVAEQTFIINDATTLRPGMVLRNRDGTYVIVKERKADDSGWWVMKRGGLADYVAQDDWQRVENGPDFVAINGLLDRLVKLGVPDSALLRIRDWMPL